MTTDCKNIFAFFVVVVVCFVVFFFLILAAVESFFREVEKNEATNLSLYVSSQKKKREKMVELKARTQERRVTALVGTSTGTQPDLAGRGRAHR